MARLNNPFPVPAVMVLVAITVLASQMKITSGHQMNIINKCDQTVWVGLLNDGTPTQVEDGGFELPAKNSKIVNLHLNWRGRIWGRTGCDASGKCQSGDCGGRLKCNGLSGASPATLAEFNFELKPEAGNLEYYDVSLVDGYNLPMIVRPTSGHDSNGGGPYDCTPIDCFPPLDQCPSELAKTSENGQITGCLSACAKFNTDQYCCRGEHDKPETCKSSDWPANYPAFFKHVCPKAYSYAYDDHKSTFTCKPSVAGLSNYEIQFC